MTNGVPTHISNEKILDYSWNWFEYHASQRLVAFRYFLIFLGILAVAIQKAVEIANNDLTRVLAILGCFISIVFFLLEFRNEQLVNVGRNSLGKIESSDSYRNESELKLILSDKGRCFLIRHSFWIKAIYVVCLIGFALLVYKPSLIINESRDSSELTNTIKPAEGKPIEIKSQ